MIGGEQMEKLLNCDQAAEILGESVTSLYRYCRQGTIPHFRLNRKIKFSPSKLQEWIDNEGRKVE